MSPVHHAKTPNDKSNSPRSVNEGLTEGRRNVHSKLVAQCQSPPSFPSNRMQLSWRETTSQACQLEKIPTFIYENSQEASRVLAAEIRELIEANAEKGEQTVLGLATGSTPVPLYRELIRLHKEEGLSFQDVVTFNLDEYFGLDPDHQESYFRFMKDQLFDHVDLLPENVHVPDGTVSRIEAFDYCQKYEQAIEEKGGLDMQILGIGRTGHIGFNEPGSTIDSRTRLIGLDRLTRLDAAADFQGESNVPRFAITMGVGTILRARRVVLMAWGENKAQIIAQAVEGPETDAVTASFIQSHPSAKILVNRSAASELTRVKLPWLTGPVDWTPCMIRRAVCWLSRKTNKPFLKLQKEDYNEHGMSDLITKYCGAYELNIEIFNVIQHTITGWPGGKPDADDAFRPERRRPHPKRSIIFAPEPQDAVTGMGGTMERLVRQGHDVVLAYQTSGDLRCSDSEAQKFADTLLEISDQNPDWKTQSKFARDILSQLDEKDPFGQPSLELRKLKGLIRRGDARNACAALSYGVNQIEFLDMPFYGRGRYRRFELDDADVELVMNLLNRLKPNQVFATGHLADPNSVQGIAWEALRRALHQIRRGSGAEWLDDCYVWLYRGHQTELSPNEIDMAVPLSPDQVENKLNAIQKFQSANNPELLDASRNRELAEHYDMLGMAEYEAIEAFERWAQNKE